MFPGHFKSLPGEVSFTSFAHCPLEFFFYHPSLTYEATDSEKRSIPKITNVRSAGAESGYRPYKEKIA